MLKTKRVPKRTSFFRMIYFVGSLIILAFNSCTTDNNVPQPIAIKAQTLTSSTVPAEITDSIGVTMRLVPGGEFIMGSDADRDIHNSAHRVYLNTLYIDKYKVTNAYYEACVTAGVCELPHFVKSNFRASYYGNPEFENYPVIYVD